MQFIRGLLGLCSATLWACTPPSAAAPEVVAGAMAAAPERPRAPLGPMQVLHNGTIMTAHGSQHGPGYLVLQGGRILAVGAGAPPEYAGAQVQDLAGAFVTPGLIDVHSHMGVYPLPHLAAHDDVNEASGAITAGVAAEHGFWPQDPALQRAVQEGGVTTVQVLPGSANLVGGRSFVAKLHRGESAGMQRFPGAPAGLKLACGENPKSVYGAKGTAPMTRMGNIAGLRQGLAAAADYSRRWQRYEAALAQHLRQRRRSEADDATPPEAPDRDLNLESLVDLQAGRLLAHVHCYRADEIHLMLDLADEFGFRLRAIHHGLEAYKVRHRLARAGVAVATWADWWGFKLEAWDGVPHNASMLTDAGVKTAIHSDSEVDVWHLNQEAAKALAAGRQVGLHIDDDAALRWITHTPAWILGIDAHTGSLEVGKMADVVVWDRHPFSVYAQPMAVFIDGDRVFDRDRTDNDLQRDFTLGMGSP